MPLHLNSMITLNWIILKLLSTTAKVLLVSPFSYESEARLASTLSATVVCFAFCWTLTIEFMNSPLIHLFIKILCIKQVLCARHWRSGRKQKTKYPCPHRLTFYLGSVVDTVSTPLSYPSVPNTLRPCWTTSGVLGLQPIKPKVQSKEHHPTLRAKQLSTSYPQKLAYKYPSSLTP